MQHSLHNVITQLIFAIGFKCKAAQVFDRLIDSSSVKCLSRLIDDVFGRQTDSSVLR